MAFQVCQTCEHKHVLPEELQTIRYWTKVIDEEHTAASISDVSHDYGWDIAEMYENLPMHAFLAERVREPTDEEFDRISQRARQLGIL